MIFLLIFGIFFWQILLFLEERLLSTSSPMLSPVVGYLNKRSVVIPSQVDAAFPREPCRREAGDPTIRIGWGGSRGQRDDISWVIPSLARIAQDNPHVKIAIMGNPNLSFYSKS